MARFDDPNDDPGELRGGLLGVMAPLYDPVEELPSGAQLHDEVHGDGVLVCPDDGDDVGVAGQVVHDLDLAAHVLDVLVGAELPLGDGLAGELFPRGLVGALVGGAELALPQPLAQRVEILEPLGVAPQHGAGEEPGALHALHLGPGVGPAVRIGGTRGVAGGVRRALGVGDGDGVGGRGGGGGGGSGGGGLGGRRGLGASGVGGGAPEHGEGDEIEEAVAVRGGAGADAGVPHRAGEGGGGHRNLGGPRRRVRTVEGIGWVEAEAGRVGGVEGTARGSVARCQWGTVAFAGTETKTLTMRARSNGSGFIAASVPRSRQPSSELASSDPRVPFCIWVV
ncbi:hypothetical protein U9M48_011771 [Paspalum notatum var. saurae]|uniref:Uncharacterized protein n=1 Tax=Paspalum notatum var. saurae TaxID=547442 RepID=A0AAQ3SWJ0_PASNO